MIDPSTALAHLPQQPAHAALSTLQRAAHDYDQQAKALNTRKAYRVDWDDFASWCVAHHLEPMPATPDTVRLYLVQLAAAGAKVATIKRRLSTISVALQMRGRETPTVSAIVTTTMQGIKRTLGTAQTQKAPLVTADLTRLVGSCEQLTPLAAARDRALLLLGPTPGFRRSELVALEVVDIAATKVGLAVAVRRSEPDPHPPCAPLALPHRPHPPPPPAPALA